MRSEAEIIVNQGPKFTRHPLGQSVNKGGSIKFSAAVSGSKPMYYQWYFNGEKIQGMETPELALYEVGTENVGLYVLKAKNDAGETESNPARLSVNLPLHLIQI